MCRIYPKKSIESFYWELKFGFSLGLCEIAPERSINSYSDHGQIPVFFNKKKIGCP